MIFRRDDESLIMRQHAKKRWCNISRLLILFLRRKHERKHEQDWKSSKATMQTIIISLLHLVVSDHINQLLPRSVRLFWFSHKYKLPWVIWKFQIWFHLSQILLKSVHLSKINSDKLIVLHLLSRRLSLTYHDIGSCLVYCEKQFF